MKAIYILIGCLMLVAAASAQEDGQKTQQQSVPEVTLDQLQQMLDTTQQVQQQQAQQQQTRQQVAKEPSKFDVKKAYFGGYINLSFGRVTTIGAAPLLGYKLTPKLSVGTQFTYDYVSDKRYTRDYNSSNYGISFFTRYRIVKSLYTHIEYEAMNYELYNVLGDSNRQWVNFLFVGGGYSQPVSRNVWLNTQILFDVLQDKNSPYRDWEPFFSVGFGVGF